MSQLDLNRTYALRRLYEKQLDKVDNKLDGAKRQKAAENMMDRLVGKEWRGEARLPGVRVFDEDVTRGGKVALNPEVFHDRVRSLLNDEGIDAPSEGQFDTEARAELEPADAEPLHCRVLVV